MQKMIDALDIELLRFLLEDSSQTYVQLSKKLGIHKDTVRKRVKHLKDLKIIDRFTIAINSDKLMDLNPGMWNVIFGVAVLRGRDALLKELLGNSHVIEVDEATPAAVHDLMVHAKFRNMEEFNVFTKWLKSKGQIDPRELDVIPVYKQHKRIRRILSAITPQQ